MVRNPIMWWYDVLLYEANYLCKRFKKWITEYFVLPNVCTIYSVHFPLDRLGFPSGYFLCLSDFSNISGGVHVLVMSSFSFYRSKIFILLLFLRYFDTDVLPTFLSVCF